LTAPWLTCRPELKVLDCTIRDGGLNNGHHFDDEFVRAVYQANVDAGVDYMEIGYKASEKVFPRSDFGPWKFCDEEDIRRIVGENDTPLKLSIMADAGKSDWKKEIVPRSESVLDMIRVAFYAHQLSEAVDMIHHAAECGYEVSANLMAVSVTGEVEVDEVLEGISKTPVNILAVVDSFGALYAEQVEALVKKYMKYIKSGNNGNIVREVGMHAHNNQQLAFANSIEAIIHGANSVDASMLGVGRGAGNCPMELMIGFLCNPKFKLRPIYKVIQDHLLPLSRQVEWGPLIQYNITGQLNEHPRTAMAARASDECDNYLDFYDKMVDDR